jgi:hypothetical protein
MRWQFSLLILLTGLASAQNQQNYWFDGNNYQANSTNYISETITPLGDGLIQFDLITQGCTRGTGGGGHSDDCDYEFGVLYRSQLTSKIPLPMNKHLEYSFQFKDISENDGVGFSGPGITIFELYPAWWSTRNNGPTHHIWYDPKSKAIEADVNKEWLGQISFMSPGWNTFIIKTMQTDKAYGYMIIIHNEKIIVDYKGPTTYNAKKGIEFWIGPYVCCSFTNESEPNHSFLYNDIRAGLNNPIITKISL